MAKKLLTTPKGIAVYPHLLVPDTKFDKAGEYHVRLRLTGEDALTFKGQIDTAMQESLAVAQKVRAEAAKTDTSKTKKKQKALALVDPPYSENEDGSIDFSFKMKASGVNKDKQPFTRKPVLFNAAGKVITEQIKLGGGSVLRVSYRMDQWYSPLGAGVSLKMFAVQVITLVEWGADASRYGFEVEESEDAETPAAATADADDDGETTEEADDNDDF